MEKLLFPFTFNTLWPEKIKRVYILSWRMLRHREFSEYEVSSRRGASIFPLLLKQGCSEPGASPHPQKKGNDLICLNIVNLIGLIWGFLWLCQGLPLFSLFSWIILVPPDIVPVILHSLFWSYSVLVLIFLYPVCATKPQISGISLCGCMLLYM